MKAYFLGWRKEDGSPYSYKVHLSEIPINQELEVVCTSDPLDACSFPYTTEWDNDSLVLLRACEVFFPENTVDLNDYV